MRDQPGLIAAAAGALSGIAGVAGLLTGVAWLGFAAGVAGLTAGLIALQRRHDHLATVRMVAESDRELREAHLLLDERDRSLDEQGQQLRQTQDQIAALQLAAAAPTPDVLPDKSASTPTRERLLSDPETGLFSEAYFRVALDARIASARRHLRPVAVAILEVTEDLGGPGQRPADPAAVANGIRQTLRDADTASRLDDGTFALILEDTPENGAVWTAERIRRNLTSRFPSLTLRAGVACYPAHAFSTDELLDQSKTALDAAKEWRQDRIEVAAAE